MHLKGSCKITALAQKHLRIKKEQKTEFKSALAHSEFSHTDSFVDEFIWLYVERLNVKLQVF